MHVALSQKVFCLEKCTIGIKRFGLNFLHFLQGYIFDYRKQNIFSWEVLKANVTYKTFFFFMKTWNVELQIIFSFEAFRANFILRPLLSFIKIYGEIFWVISYGLTFYRISLQKLAAPFHLEYLWTIFVLIQAIHFEKQWFYNVHI